MVLLVRPESTRKARPKSLVASFSRRRRPPAPGSNSTSTSERTLDSNMSVKVSVVQTDFPLGVEKLLNLAEIGIQDRTEVEEDEE